MMLTNPRHKKHAEKIIEYCEKHGMEHYSTLGLWNTLVRIFRKLENAEEKGSAQNQPTTTGMAVPGSTLHSNGGAA